MTAKRKNKETEVATAAASPATPLAKEPESKGALVASVSDKPPSPALLDIIAGVIANPEVDVAKIQALLDMKSKEEGDARRLAYNKAMHAAQSEMVPIVTKAWNDATKSYFAKLAHVDNIIRPIYAKHGFSLSFDSLTPPGTSVITMFVDVLHNEGHVERKQLAAEVDDKGPKGTPNKTQPQGVASTTTILQRKLTVFVFNLTFINDDDDGQGGKKVKDKKPEEDDFSRAARAEANAANTVELKKSDGKDKTKVEAAAQMLIDKLKECKVQDGKDRIMGANLPLVRAVSSLGLQITLDAINKHAKVEATNA